MSGKLVFPSLASRYRTNGLQNGNWITIQNTLFLHEEILLLALRDEEGTVVLLSLANSTGLLKVVFDKKKLKGRKARIKQIVNGEITGKAATEAIQAMRAAVMVACIMPTLMATLAVIFLFMGILLDDAPLLFVIWLVVFALLAKVVK